MVTVPMSCVGIVVFDAPSSRSKPMSCIAPCSCCAISIVARHCNACISYMIRYVTRSRRPSRKILNPQCCDACRVQTLGQIDYASTSKAPESKYKGLLMCIIMQLCDTISSTEVVSGQRSNSDAPVWITRKSMLVSMSSLILDHAYGVDVVAFRDLCY